MTRGKAVTGLAPQLLTCCRFLWSIGRSRSGEERRREVYEIRLYEIQTLMREFESKIPTRDPRRAS